MRNRITNNIPHHIHPNILTALLFNFMTLQVDMIVNITTQSLELKGRVSSSILKAAGSGILKELEKSYPYSISEGEVAVTTGHRLKCKYVVHGYMTSWPLNPPKTSVEVSAFNKCINYILTAQIECVNKPCFN